MYYENNVDVVDDVMEDIVFNHDTNKNLYRKHRNKIKKDKANRKLQKGVAYPTRGAAKFCKKMCHRYNRRNLVDGRNYYKNQYSRSSVWWDMT